MAASSSALIPDSERRPIPADSLFERQGFEYEKLLLQCGYRNLSRDLAREVVSYMVGNENPFGAAEWRKYFNVDVGPEPELSREFYQFWYGPDPVDPTKKVCETHLPPVLCPQFVTDIATNTQRAYSLEVLGQLVQTPREGHRSQYLVRSEALRQHGGTPAERTHWLVMRKEVFARNQPYDRQMQFMRDLNARTNAGYEESLSGLDVATIALTRYVATEERYLGDGTGIERRWTFSRCRERVRYGDDEYPMVVGGFAPGGLDVYDFNCYAHEDNGVAALRGF